MRAYTDMVPLAGEAFDFANGVWYTIEGDGTNAAISFASTVPLVYATTVKNVGKVVKLANGTTVLVKFSEEATERLVDVLKRLDLDAAQLQKLSDDLVNKEFAEAIAENPELVDAWDILKNTGLKTDVKWLKKVSDFKKTGLELVEEGAEIKIVRQGDEIAKISEDALQIKIPYGEGWARQSTSNLALKTLNEVRESRKAYRLGTLNKSQAGEAQFWSPENPYDYDDIWKYAEKYGIPEDNLLGDNVFFEIGIIEDGVPLITREAPAFGDNLGGAIEVVVPSKSMKLESFNMVTFEK